MGRTRMLMKRQKWRSSVLIPFVNGRTDRKAYSLVVEPIQHSSQASPKSRYPARAWFVQAIFIAAIVEQETAAANVGCHIQQCSVQLLRMNSCCLHSHLQLHSTAAYVFCYVGGCISDGLLTRDVLKHSLNLKGSCFLEDLIQLLHACRSQN